MKKGSHAFSAGGLFLAAVVCFGSTASGRSAGAPQTASDLTTAAEGRGWTVVNRAATVVEEGGRKFLRLDERAGDGQVWLDGVSFAAGTIEFDVRGKDVFQRSFVGAAFHGTDDRTFEAVYFRPFNFEADDPARKNHAVQYVSHPDHTWQRLRADKPGQYENPVSPVPDPNGWFHVRIVVDPPKINVFVDGAAAPCLTVDALGEGLGGKVGVMVGNGSGGDFTGFKLTPSAVSPGAPPRPASASMSLDVFQAAQAGNLERVKALVDGDPALVDARNPGGRTPLLIAIGSRQTAIAEYLLSKGADVNAADSFQTTPLHLACAAGAPIEVVRLLVDRGADVNAVAKYSGKPLDSALDSGNAEIIACLESQGAKATPLDFEVRRLAPGLHRIAYSWGMRNNVVVFSGPEGILLLDSGFSEHAVPELGKAIGGVAAGDIKYLINTHLHGDHVAANAVAPEGAAVLNGNNLDGPDSKRRIVESDAPFRGRGTRDFAVPWVFRFNGEEILIIPNPGLHSPEDLMFYFPKAEVLCMGDLLLAGSCPAVPDAAGYMAFLDKVLAAFPEETTFVSGHGPDLTKAGLKTYRDGLAEMIAVVRKSVEAGKSVEDMLREDILEAYKADYSFLDWIGPDSWLRRAAQIK